MIKLTKINGELILVNPGQIEYIEVIPESKIIMMNGRYHLVREDADEIIRRVIEYNSEFMSLAHIIARQELGEEMSHDN